MRWRIKQASARYLSDHTRVHAAASGQIAYRLAPLPTGAPDAVNRYLDCGIFAGGFARVRCGDCGHDYFVAFSCKLRCICPSCHMKRELIWAEWAAKEPLSADLLLENIACAPVEPGALLRV